VPYDYNITAETGSEVADYRGLDIDGSFHCEILAQIPKHCVALRSWKNRAGSGADGKLYIRNADGTAQGFAVR
jgi:hypothetical protein